MMDFLGFGRRQRRREEMSPPKPLAELPSEPPLPDRAQRVDKAEEILDSVRHQLREAGISEPEILTFSARFALEGLRIRDERAIAASHLRPLQEKILERIQEKGGELKVASARSLLLGLAGDLARSVEEGSRREQMKLSRAQETYGTARLSLEEFLKDLAETKDQLASFMESRGEGAKALITKYSGTRGWWQEAFATRREEGAAFREWVISAEDFLKFLEDFLSRSRKRLTDFTEEAKERHGFTYDLRDFPSGIPQEDRQAFTWAIKMAAGFRGADPDEATRRVLLTLGILDSWLRAFWLERSAEWGRLLRSQLDKVFLGRIKSSSERLSQYTGLAGELLRLQRELAC